MEHMFFSDRNEVNLFSIKSTEFPLLILLIGSWIRGRPLTLKGNANDGLNDKFVISVGNGTNSCDFL